MSDIDYDGEIADNYAQGRSLSVEALATWRSAVEPHVPSSGAIVDIGAGTGRFARPLSAIARRSVIAVEPAAGMRGTGAAAGPDVSWAAGSAEALPLAAGSAGLMWSAFTAHYLDLDRSAAELVRVLRPGGVVLIWHAFPDVFDDLEWFRWFPSARAIDETRMPSVAAVTRAFESSGLAFETRTDHRMLITQDLASLADRLAHRSISTLRLISDHEFEDGMARLRAAADRQQASGPIYAPNVMLCFRRPV